MSAFAGFPEILRDAVSREHLVALYETLSGRLIFYIRFNLFRLGMILQQIYYRYYHGVTRDERFGAFKFMVASLMAAWSGI